MVETGFSATQEGLSAKGVERRPTNLTLPKSTGSRSNWSSSPRSGGPRDITRHSKWPLFLQMQGSILPTLLVPLLFLGSWATFITVVSKYTRADLGTGNTLLTATGFVVGLGLSFRSSTAYERYGPSSSWCPAPWAASFQRSATCSSS